VEDQCDLHQHPERGLAVRQRRDTSAFSEFVEARSHALLRTAYLMLGDQQLAQDLLQEALIKTLVAWPRLRDPEKVEAYVKRTIVTTAISWRRRRSFHERPVEFLPETSVLDQADVLATHEVLVAHLRGLPPRQRAAIVLRYYEDLTEAQTAEVMGCSAGAVKSHVSIGLGKLRERMGAAFEVVPTSEEGVPS
jgi:RNA polymerase sigma-70 factor (sigma-E family)